MSDIKLVRLISGEEILAKTTKNDGVYKLEDPLCILTSLVPLNEDASETDKIINDALPLRKSIKIFHFIPMSKVPYLEIKEDHVLFEYEPIPDVVNNYTTFFGKNDFAITKLPALHKVDNRTL